VQFVAGLLIAVGAAYAAGLAYLWVTQRSHVFHPAPGPLNLASTVVASHMSEVVVSNGDGMPLIAWYAAAKPGYRTIAYFHGNAGTLADRHERVLPYLLQGYGVLLVGYRGYGGNPSEPSELGLYDDARSQLAWLARQGVENGDLILYGESLGAAVAVQMAREQAPAALVLEAPFASVLLSARHRYPLFAFDWLVKDKFANIDKIDSVRAPIFIIHGARDRVTPIRFGRMLYERANQPKFAVWLPEAGHNDLAAFGMIETVMRFLDGLPPTASKGG